MTVAQEKLDSIEMIEYVAHTRPDRHSQASISVFASNIHYAQMRIEEEMRTPKNAEKLAEWENGGCLIKERYTPHQKEVLAKLTAEGLTLGDDWVKVKGTLRLTVSPDSNIATARVLLNQAHQLNGIPPLLPYSATKREAHKQQLIHVQETLRLAISHSEIISPEHLASCMEQATDIFTSINNFLHTRTNEAN